MLRDRERESAPEHHWVIENKIETEVLSVYPSQCYLRWGNRYATWCRNTTVGAQQSLATPQKLFIDIWSSNKPEQLSDLDPSHESRAQSWWFRWRVSWTGHPQVSLSSRILDIWRDLFSPSSQVSSKMDFFLASSLLNFQCAQRIIHFSTSARAFCDGRKWYFWHGVIQHSAVKFLTGVLDTVVDWHLGMTGTARNFLNNFFSSEVFVMFKTIDLFLKYREDQSSTWEQSVRVHHPFYVI